MVSSGRHVGGASRCPAICAGNVSPASVQKVVGTIKKNPRPRRSFRCPSTPPCGQYRPEGALILWYMFNCRARIVSLAGVEITAAVDLSAPGDHFAPDPHCRVTNSGRPAAGADGRPTVAAGTVSPTVVEDEPPRLRPRRSFQLPVHTAE